MLFIHTGSGITLFCDLANLVAVVMISLLSIMALLLSGTSSCNSKRTVKMNWISIGSSSRYVGSYLHSLHLDHTPCLVDDHISADPRLFRQRRKHRCISHGDLLFWSRFLRRTMNSR